MKTEIEAKFLHVDPEDIRRRLESADATCKQPMKDMRRVIFRSDDMDSRHAYLRVRDEGYRVAMTYKQFDEMSLTGAKEIEFNVGDYEAAVELLKTIGLEARSVQETRREIWELGDAEVVIDEWPWIDHFIEIEASSEEAVKSAAEKLGFDWNEAAFGDIMTAYRAEYPHLGNEPKDMVYNLPVVRLGDPLPDMLKV
ncbi:MAG TPA: class IV adenylate cyclase [Candidatus Saccharimonadales bacterium]|nr:class IV adenylate cyclase [Candidatus Saccharimonadales bacterium]